MNALVRLFHRHSWKDTRRNLVVATEQRCRCGEFRHHMAADWARSVLGDEPRWHAGRHPANREMYGATSGQAALAEARNGTASNST